MAFNPFHGFRKHQKKFLAGLTIFCMLIFVLQFGFGDVFDRVTYWFRGYGSKDIPVASLYGRTVTARDVQRVQGMRRIASAFMVAATDYVRYKMFILSFQERNRIRMSFPELGRKLQFLDSPQSNLPPAFLRRYLQSIQQESEKAGKKEEADALTRLIDFEDKSARLPPPRPKELYFGGSLSPNVPDALDFLIWQHQADRFGIRLSENDVQQLVNKDTADALSDTDMANINREVKLRFNYTVEDLQKALHDEYRARLAQEAMLGYGSDQGLSDLTPYQFWQYYRENRTQGQVAVLPVPVKEESFLAKVPKPIDAELRDFYDAHKNQQYSPDSEKAGFKQPPRVRVEWVRPDPAYYRKEAERSQAAARAASEVGSAAAAAVTGGFPAAAAAGAALPQSHDLALVAEYEVRKLLDYKAPLLSEAGYAGAYYPADAASAAGAVGRAAAGLGPVGAVMAYEGGTAARQSKEARAALEEEARRRIAFNAGLLLSGSARTPLTTGGMVSYARAQEQFVPLSAVTERVRDRLLVASSRKLAADAITRLRQKVESLGKIRTTADALQYLRANRPQTIASIAGLAAAIAGPSPAGVLALTAGVAAAAAPNGPALEAAQAFLAGAGLRPVLSSLVTRNPQLLTASLVGKGVEQALAAGGYRHGASDRADDAYNIGDDPGLKPLDEAYKASGAGFDTSRRKLSSLFFTASGEPVRKDLYSPQEVRSGAEPFLCWMTAEQPAYVPPFEEVRGRVLARWQLEKARPFAEAAADEVAARAKTGKAEDELNRLAKRFGRDVFYLSGVAPLVPSSAMGFQRYEIPETERDRIEYPGKDAAEKLLTLKDKGQVVVFSDQPKAHYYVAALLFRTPPPVSSFYEDYANPNARAQLLSLMEQDTHFQEREREAVLQRLRDAARLQIDEENSKTLNQERRNSSED